MKSFNLLDEPWIPCVRADGACVELGLAQVIDQAHELREVYEDSPLVTVALHRLLLAVLHRAYAGPRRKSDWHTLWEAGRFDASAVGGYLKQWATRFDLLHPERPFYQCRDSEILEAKLHPASALRQELASGNNATLFDHGRVARFSLAEAARALVAVQQFALGGGVSKPFNLCHAPLIAGVVVHVRGHTLFQTLMLNLMLYSRPGQLPIVSEADDAPAWEAPWPPEPEKRPPHGYLEYLTWQSRRVLLDVDGSTVQGVRMLQGLAVDAPHLVDPFMPLRRSKELGMLPLRLQQDRAVWRDAHVLLAHESGEDGEYKRPEVLRHAAQMLDYPPALQLDILGLCSDQAKVNFWRHERLPLPSLYLTDPKSAVHVHELLELSRNAGSALQAALRTLAEHLTASRLGGNTRSGHRETIDKLARSFGGMAAFWGALEPEFQRQYVELPDKDWEELHATWCGILRRCARQALERAFSGYEESARSLRAVAEAKRHLNGRLKIVLPEPNKETAAHG